MTIDGLEFDRVCKLAGLSQPKTDVHLWTTKDRMEAIELTKDGRILTFWNKNGERIYDDPISDKHISDVFEAFKENKHLNDTNIPEKLGKKDTNIIMPEYLTNALFEKWQKMPVSERLIMLQTTDSRYVKERPGRAGQKYSYVEGHYMTMAANMAFGFEWSSCVQQWEKTDSEIICMGYVEAVIGGKTISKYAIGQKDIAFRKDSKSPLCLGDDYKSAEMDMIKKALSFFGIAKDVYSGEV